MSSLSATIDNGIGAIEFSHPKANSLPAAILKELAEKISSFSLDENVKAIKLTSGGEKTFCAGASFDELVSLKTEKEAVEYFMGFAHVMLAMKNCSKIIVTGVQGKAVGGALGLIAASDYVVASESAAVRLSELALGLGAFVISEPIIRRIGVGHFSSLSLDTEWRNAEWAASVGLFSKVVGTYEELHSSMDELLQGLAKGHDKALLLMKHVCWDGTEDWEKKLKERAEYSGALALTSWVQERIKKS